MQDSAKINSNSTEIVFEFFPCVRVYKDGHIHRFHVTDFAPPSQDPETNVLSKDVLLSPENKVSVRIYKPKSHGNHKLPLLIYIHGGGFCVQSAFSSQYHSYVNNVVSEANVIAVSVEYRLAPEHPIPACYNDSWSAFKWVVSNHSNGENNQEPWLRDYADFSRMFLAGDSAGANIAHDMMVRASVESNELAKPGVKVLGMALVHPFFGDSEPEKLWTFFCKDLNSGFDDPRLNPALHVDLLEKLVCKKILICTAEKDFLRQRGWKYYEAIKNSGWDGEVEIEETEGEDHVFHLKNPGSDNAGYLLKRLSNFMK